VVAVLLQGVHGSAPLRSGRAGVPHDNCEDRAARAQRGSVAVSAMPRRSCGRTWMNTRASAWWSTRCGSITALCSSAWASCWSRRAALIQRGHSVVHRGTTRSRRSGLLVWSSVRSNRRSDRSGHRDGPLRRRRAGPHIRQARYQTRRLPTRPLAERDPNHAPEHIPLFKRHSPSHSQAKRAAESNGARLALPGCSA
jgi:hypothetical protein